MPVFVESLKRQYQLFSHVNEEDFEGVIKNIADKIFGNTSIYLDIKRKVKGREIISIPDGYLIDLADPSEPRLFVVENEIVSHDPFRHIGIQLLKFVVSFNDARTEIRKLLMEAIQSNKEYLSRLTAACNASSYRNVDNYLDAAVYSDFRGLVIIDEIKPELNKVLEKINANISVLEVKTFQADDGSLLYQYDTLYDEDEDTIAEPIEEKAISPEHRERRRQRRAKSDTIIVPAREDGFKAVFLGENQWYQIRIGAAMKDKIKYIAAYQVAPVSAVTHIAEVASIKPYKDTGKYVVIFKGPAQEIKAIRLKERKNSPQGPVYVEKEKLLSSACLEDALKSER